MKQAVARFDKTSNILLVLILPPLAVIPTIISLAKFAPGLPDWVVIGIIALSIVLLVAITVPLVLKMSPKCVVTVDDDGFRVDFPDIGIFVPQPFEIKAEDLTACKTGVSKGGLYVRLKTAVSPSQFNLSLGSGTEEEIRAFADIVMLINRMFTEKDK